MPARTDSTTVKPVAAAPTPAKRFELPVLEFNFASLTEGTDIPPPLPSPIEEEVVAPPKTPAKEQKEKPSKINGSNASLSPQSNVTTTTVGGTKRPADDNPASPTFSTRQGSIRRLFSKNLLNTAYADGEESVNGDARRPVSRTSASFVESKKAKRSSGWFSRLRSSDSAGNKRASIAVAPEEKKPTGPPPPMIPELSELKSSVDIKDEGLGSDLFKDIK
jgi:hypothetical protein